MKKNIHDRWKKDESEIPVHYESITISVNKNNVDFHLVHNFNMLQLDLYKALKEWADITYEPTVDDFCYFVFENSPNNDLFCIPQEKWSEFLIEQKFNKGAC